MATGGAVVDPSLDAVAKDSGSGTVVDSSLGVVSNMESSLFCSRSADVIMLMGLALVRVLSVSGWLSRYAGVNPSAMARALCDVVREAQRLPDSLVSSLAGFDSSIV